MDSAEVARRACSFGSLATDYDRVRPSYPPEAVAWLTEALPGSHVLDVGAGTGKMTRALQAAGLTVTAVEPDPGMRALLGAGAVAGRGEQLPAEDGTVDAVVFAQAFHWTDQPRAVAEAARVLVPDGLLSLAWNIEDPGVGWLREVHRVAGDNPSLDDDLSPPHPPAHPCLGDVQEATFRWEQVLPSADDVAVLASTWSWVSTLPPVDRERVLQGVRDVAREAAQPDGAVRLPRLCLCLRQRRL